MTKFKIQIDFNGFRAITLFQKATLFVAAVLMFFCLLGLGPILDINTAHADTKMSQKNSKERTKKNRTKKLLSKRSKSKKPSKVKVVSQSGFSKSKISTIKKKEKPKRWGGVVAIQGSRSFHQTDDHNLRADSSLLFAPSYKLGNDWSLGSELVLNKQFVDDEKLSLSNLKIKGKYKSFDLGAGFSFQPAITLRLPTNDEARNVDHFFGAYQVEPEFSFGYKIFTWIYKPRFSQYFHEYELDNDGSPNKSLSLEHITWTGFKVLPSVTLGFSFLFIQNWNYSGTLSEVFVSSQDISISLNKKWGLLIGHTNSGLAFKDNGVDSNISVIDRDASSFYVELSYLL